MWPEYGSSAKTCSACAASVLKPRRMAKATALMLADLGVVKSHSRPHTSNDNPFSEAHFKTLKYQPEFPKRKPTPRAVFLR